MSVSGSAPGPGALVTGAGGFIGRHLVRELAERGHSVVAFDPAPPPALEGVRQVAGDVRDAAARRDALEGIDTVYHLAACHLGVKTPAEEFHAVNVQATDALVRASAEAGVRRFVHTSSVGVYGRIADPPADEDSPCTPRLVYERTKLEGERAALAAAGEVGLPVVVLRPAWVYGPGCPRTEKLFRAIGRGRFVVGGNGRRLRHGVYIRDMLAAFLLAARAEAAVGQVIVVADAGAVSVRTWIDEIARLTGARRPPGVPLVALEVAARTLELGFRPFAAEPPLSRRTLEFFTSNTSFRIDRARRLLGFEPRYDYASGLAETWEQIQKGGAAA